jgi:hypothetical protein
MTPPAPHWAEQYLFADWRWAENGQGPRDWNCWSFVRELQRKHFDRPLPALPIGDEAGIRAALAEFPARSLWRKRSGEPREGDVLLMRGMDLHVGLWIEADGGGVLHCQRDRDVTFDDLRGLQFCGYRIERVWAWRGN